MATSPPPEWDVKPTFGYYNNNNVTYVKRLFNRNASIFKKEHMNFIIDYAQDRNAFLVMVNTLCAV